MTSKHFKRFKSVGLTALLVFGIIVIVFWFARERKVSFDYDVESYAALDSKDTAPWSDFEDFDWDSVTVVKANESIPYQEFHDKLVHEYALNADDADILVDDSLTFKFKKNKKTYDVNFTAHDQTNPQIIVNYKGEPVTEDTPLDLETADDVKFIEVKACDVCFQKCYTEISVDQSGNFDANTPGVQEVIYTAKDASDNITTFKLKAEFKVKQQESQTQEATENEAEATVAHNTQNDTATTGSGSKGSATSQGSNQAILAPYMGTDRVLVTRRFKLPKSFVPKLADIPTGYAVSAGYEAAPHVVNDFVAMVDALKAETGLWMYATSSYRDYDFQNELYTGYIASHGQREADRMSAKPGHSEHQTGLVIDVVSAGGYMFSFKTTPQSTWVNANAHRFGFIVRYPEGKEHITGYMPEAWHLRYIGKDLASKVYQSGLTFDEYLGY